MKLHLNLKGEYFDEIASGDKIIEFRRYNDYWKRRLLDRHYDGIVIKRGYPKKDDKSKIIERPWRGFTIHTIQHEQFGSGPVKVFAIRVNEGIGK